MDYVFAILGAASVFILVISKKCSTFAADFDSPKNECLTIKKLRT